MLTHERLGAGGHGRLERAAADRKKHGGLGGPLQHQDRPIDQRERAKIRVLQMPEALQIDIEDVPAHELITQIHW